MKFLRIETPGISHYAYLIADGGEAVVVDPRRDVEVYLDGARELGARIRYVAETHRQEDFVMGSAHLAALTGAQVVNGNHELFGHGDLRLNDGDTFRVGGLLVKAIHTPGHTPESMSYAIYTAPDNEVPWCVLTGDTLFFGTTGRTDLPDAAQSVANAGLLFDSVHGKLAGLGDTTLVLPAHGPGSVCGSGMAERPYSTIGDEKRYNEVFTLDRDAFSKKKGGERLARPPYFRHMEQVNLDGGIPPRNRAGVVRLLDVASFTEMMDDGVIYDTREPEGFAGGHIAGSYSIWMGGLPVFGGWAGTETTPICLVTDREADIDTAVAHLSRIGIDTIRGGLAGGFASWRSSIKPLEFAGSITPPELAARQAEFQVLDVREVDEFDEGHIPGATNLFVGHLVTTVENLELDRQKPVVVTCGVGHRAGLGVSILLKAGFADVRNLLGGMKAWQALELPLE
jgi:hydroxyacylglutathione hydrolase